MGPPVPFRLTEALGPAVMLTRSERGDSNTSVIDTSNGRHVSCATQGGRNSRGVQEIYNSPSNDIDEFCAFVHVQLKKSFSAQAWRPHIVEIAMWSPVAR